MRRTTLTPILRTLSIFADLARALAAARWASIFHQVDLAKHVDSICLVIKYLQDTDVCQSSFPEQNPQSLRLKTEPRARDGMKFLGDFLRSEKQKKLQMPLGIKPQSLKKSY